MDQGILILIIILSALAGIFLLLFIFAAMVDHIAFGRRYDKNPLLKYFTAEDFSLSARPVSVHFKKTELNGFVYQKSGVLNNQKLIIFCHGMGPGHIAYTTEIAYFCNRGFTVLALDNMGCNLSGGKKIKGMYSGAEAAIAAVDFAESDGELKELTPYLVGHSWGGYSALCASEKRSVAGVVAISAPSSPIMTVAEAAVNVLPKILAVYLIPFLAFIVAFKYGGKGATNAARCAAENDTRTLLIHGDNDKIVGRSNGAFYRAQSEYIEKHLATGKAHNPYNTVQAEQKLAELTLNLSRAKKMTEEVRNEYFSSFDFTAATQEDEEIMSLITDFLQK